MSAIPANLRRSRKWVWIFVVLAVLGALAIGINLVFSVSQQLTPEQLVAARSLWTASRPTDYDLTIKRIASGEAGGTIVEKLDVQVRRGQVTGLLVDGREPEPLLNPDDTRNITAERHRREGWDMDGLFDAIESFMDKDRRDGIKPFLTARFDPNDGHLLVFTRRANKQRVQIQVEMKRVP